MRKAFLMEILIRKYFIFARIFLSPQPYLSATVEAESSVSPRLFLAQPKAELLKLLIFSTW